MTIHPSVYEPSLTTERPLQPAEGPVEPEGRAELPEQLPNIRVTDRGEEEAFVPSTVVDTGVERETFTTLLPIPKRERDQTRKMSQTSLLPPNQ